MLRVSNARGVLAVLTVAMAGCQCEQKEPTCNDATLVIDSPAPFAQVTSPFEVTVSATVDGGPFAVDAASLRIGSQVFYGEVSGHQATFTAVAADGPATLYASIAHGSCSRTVSRQVQVGQVSCESPLVTSVTFPQDTGAPLGILNRLELPPGTALQVRVYGSCLDDGVQVRIKRGDEVVGALTDFIDGTALVTLPSLPDGDGAYELFAELLRDGEALNQALGPAVGRVRVQREEPQCQVTTQGVHGPFSDVVPGGDYQLRITGVVEPRGSGIFNINDELATVVPAVTGEVSADYTLPGSGEYTVQLTCFDDAGNQSVATGTFTVDLDAPVFTVTSPANFDGGVVGVIAQSPLTVTISVSSDDDGAVAVVSRDGTPVAVGVVENGQVQLEVPFGDDGVYELEFHVVDLAGNEATLTLTVTVQLTGCGLVFTQPSTSPVLLTAGDLTGGGYVFTTSSKPLCQGQSASLFRAQVLPDGGVTAETQVSATTLGAGGVATFPSVAMSDGLYNFRAQVVNPGMGAGVSVANALVAVDLTGPVITSPTAPAVLNVAGDSAPGTPGVQRQLAFNAVVPLGGHVDVCTTQGVDPVSGTARATSPECGSGWFVLQENVVSPAAAFTFPEGSYSIKVVVVGTGVTPAPASAALAILSDATRPCVNGMTRLLPQDINGDGRLSISELAGQPPRISFQPGCGDLPTGLHPTTPVVIRDIIAGVPGASRPATFSLAGTVITATLGGSWSADLDLELFVELMDPAGNTNQYTGVADDARFAFSIDPVAPACVITSPSPGLLGLAQVPGGALNMQVNTSADVGTGGVLVGITAQSPLALTPSSGTASTTWTVTGDNTHTLTATCTDAAGNETTATPVTVQVDLVAPTCSFTAPANGATVPGPAVLTTLAIGGVDDGSIVTLSSSLSGIANNLLTVSGGVASGAVQYPLGTQTVSAQLADAAGNECVAPFGGSKSITLTVEQASCALNFTATGPVHVNANGNWLNRAGAGLPQTGPTPANASAAISAVTSDCGAGKNVYLYPGEPVPSPGGAPQVTNGAGEVTFPAQLFDEGARYTVTIDEGSGVLTHRSFDVSLKAPTVTALSLQRSLEAPVPVTVLPGASLLFGAATGNRQVELAGAATMAFGDLNGAVEGAQFALTVTGIDGARVGAFNAALDVLEGATPLMAPVAVTSDGFNAALPQLTLAHRTDETSTTLVLLVTSPAGNTWSSTHDSQVDVVPPAAPAVTRTVTAARAATVSLQWAPVYDDGTDSSSGPLTGPGTGYDIRWTTSSVPGSNNLGSATDFFGDSVKEDGMEAWAPGTINRVLSVPPLNTYFIAVRAIDEVGNYSAFAQPPALDNWWTQVTLTAPVAGSTFGQNLVTAALTGNDTLVELAVAATTEPGGGAVYVYSNAALATSQTGCGAGCQRLAPPAPNPAGGFGTDLSAGGNLGDVAGEGKADLVVAHQWNGNPNAGGGRVMVYFGTTAATLDVSQAIELRGDATTRIGWSAQIIGDLDGDGLDELSIASPTWNGSQGRVLIYRGRAHAAWAALRTATDIDSGAPYVPVSAANADWVIDGPTPTTNSFGLNRRGVINVGDLDGDGRLELGVSTSRGTIGRYRVYASSDILTSSGVSPLPGTYRLEVTQTPTGDISIASGLGTAAVSGNILGATQPDLLVSYPGAPEGGRLYVYGDVLAPDSPTVNPPVATIIRGPVSFGVCVSAAAVDGDGHTDVLGATALGSNNSAWLTYQHGGVFEAGPQAAPRQLGVVPWFWATKFDATAITGRASSFLGWSNALVDVSGDGLADVILSDIDAPGEVRIWR